MLSTAHNNSGQIKHMSWLAEQAPVLTNVSNIFFAIYMIIPYILGYKSHFFYLNISLYFACDLYLEHTIEGSRVSMNQKNMSVLCSKRRSIPRSDLLMIDQRYCIVCFLGSVSF